MNILSYISENASTIANVLMDEIQSNKREVSRYNSSQWDDKAKKMAQEALDAEFELIARSEVLHLKRDSVHGAKAIRAVDSRYMKKDTDLFTLKSYSIIQLSEAKYVIKDGGVGPFGGPGSFKDRVSGKFLDMGAALSSMGCKTEPLRIIIVTEEHLPLAINHLHALVDGDYEEGTFSSDQKTYPYVICSSIGLRKIIDDVSCKSRSSHDYFFFTL